MVEQENFDPNSYLGILEPWTRFDRLADAGVATNHYVEVDFAGFAAIVDQLGGIDFYFALPSRDLKEGISAMFAKREPNFTGE